MCLGIPGRVVGLATAGPELANVDVRGVPRTINMSLLEGRWQPGDWVLVHTGFALSRMTEEEAAVALSLLQEFAEMEGRG